MSVASGWKIFLSLFGLLTNFLFITVAKGSTIEISEATSHQLFRGEWMVMFYAPWCPACKSLKPSWQTFAKQWSDDLAISVGAVDINKNPGLSGQFLVFQLPSLFHIKDGIVRRYTGARSQDAFVNWVNDKSWKNIDPIEWWKNPNSIHMKGVGLFFRFANFIKDIHEQLHDTHNVPTAAIYALFAVVTILTGLLLGMILVVICDCVYPPKPPPPTADQRQYSKVEIAKTQLKSQQKKSKKDKSPPVDAPAEPKADPTPDAPADDGTTPDEAAEGKSSEECDAAGNVRKRKPRRE